MQSKLPFTKFFYNKSTSSSFYRLKFQDIHQNCLHKLYTIVACFMGFAKSITIFSNLENIDLTIFKLSQYNYHYISIGSFSICIKPKKTLKINLNAFRGTSFLSF